MVDPKMFRVTKINQPVVAAPTVRMNDRFNPDTPANNGLQRFSLDVRNDFGKNFTVSFVDSKDDGFARCSATAFALDSFRSEIRFINFDFTGKR